MKLTVLTIAALLTVSNQAVSREAIAPTSDSPMSIGCLGPGTIRPAKTDTQLTKDLRLLTTVDRSPLQVRGFGEGRYFAKVGLAARGRISFKISSPNAHMTWQNSGQSRIFYSEIRGKCRDTTARWRASPGGFLIRSPSACVTLIASQGNEAPRSIQIAIGAPCPH